MIIVLVDEDDLKTRMLQLIGEFQSSEPSANDDHALFAAFRYIKTHNKKTLIDWIDDPYKGTAFILKQMNKGRYKI